MNEPLWEGEGVDGEKLSIQLVKSKEKRLYVLWQGKKQVQQLVIKTEIPEFADNALEFLKSAATRYAAGKLTKANMQKEKNEYLCGLKGASMPAVFKKKPAAKGRSDAARAKEKGASKEEEKNKEVQTPPVGPLFRR